jgi:penicillin amidase
MRRALRVLRFVLLFFAAAAAGCYVYLRQSLPLARGEIAIGGLGAPVEVLRDRHGIPHIYAASRGPAKLRVPEMNY